MYYMFMYIRSHPEYNSCSRRTYIYIYIFHLNIYYNFFRKKLIYLIFTLRPCFIMYLYIIFNSNCVSRLTFSRWLQIHPNRFLCIYIHIYTRIIFSDHRLFGDIYFYTMFINMLCAYIRCPSVISQRAKSHFIIICIVLLLCEIMLMARRETSVGEFYYYHNSIIIL